MVCTRAIIEYICYVTVTIATEDQLCICCFRYFSCSVDRMLEGTGVWDTKMNGTCFDIQYIFEHTYTETHFIIRHPFIYNIIYTHVCTCKNV